jgi:hypothetical protein
MPGHLEFDVEHKILLMVAEGEIRDTEILAAKSYIAEVVNRLRPSAGITDLSRVTRFDVSSETMRRAARQPSPYPPEIPTFIVAPQEHLFGIARMYELLGASKRSNLRVVHSLEQALADLRVGPAKFETITPG